MIRAALDALLVDIGGTLVREAAPGTPVSDLTVVPLPHVVEDLAELAVEVPIIAVTNTSVMLEADVLGLLAEAGLSEHLVGAVTSAEIGVAKPDPAPVLAALARLGDAGQAPSRVLFIGDLPTDETAAAAAGVRYAAVAEDGLMATVVRWMEAHAGQAFSQAAADIRPPLESAAADARDLHSRLTKPAGSLGALEELGARLSAMAGKSPPSVPTPAALAIFAADHGVAVTGVTPWPREVTTQMVENLARGGAAANVLARQMDVRLTVVDVGTAGAAAPPTGAVDRRVAYGTANLAEAPAMSAIEAMTALDVGVQTAQQLAGTGAVCLLTGDMGIGNTTASAALISALTGSPPEATTGRGTGIDDEALALKIDVIGRALKRTAGKAGVELLAELGGLEIAGLAGFIVGGAARRVPVVLDGVVTVAAALVAETLAPGVSHWCIAGHRSVEPGARVALEHLNLAPLLDLGLRLGEGTGALLAYPLVVAAARVLREMATFEQAEISPLAAE